MNDRYLYRAKHIHVLPCNDHLDGTWVIGYLSGEHYISNEDGDHLIDPETICQCTGLKDKYGKLIFENDIVKVHDDEEPCLIEWGEDTARWNMTQYGSCVYDFDNYWSYEVEVICSAIDNPELLESKGCD